MAPAPVKIQARIETGPAVPASVAGSRNTPEPTMLPTTSAVAIHRPIERLSLGRAAPLAGAAATADGVDMAPPLLGYVSHRPSRARARHPPWPRRSMRRTTVHRAAPCGWLPRNGCVERPDGRDDLVRATRRGRGSPGRRRRRPRSWALRRRERSVGSDRRRRRRWGPSRAWSRRVRARRRSRGPVQAAAGEPLLVDQPPGAFDSRHRRTPWFPAAALWPDPNGVRAARPYGQGIARFEQEPDMNTIVPTIATVEPAECASGGRVCRVSRSGCR